MKFSVHDRMMNDKGIPSNHLCITLEEDEELNDDVLDLLSPGQCVQIHYKAHPSFHRLHITCTAEAMARANPKALWLGGNVSHLEDGIFEGCTLLQELMIGACDDALFANGCPHLTKLSLKALRLGGYGHVRNSDGLDELIHHVKQNGGEIEMFY